MGEELALTDKAKRHQKVVFTWEVTFLVTHVVEVGEDLHNQMLAHVEDRAWARRMTECSSVVEMSLGKRKVISAVAIDGHNPGSDS